MSTMDPTMTPTAKKTKEDENYQQMLRELGLYTPPSQARPPTEEPWVDTGESDVDRFKGPSKVEMDDSYQWGPDSSSSRWEFLNKPIWYYLKPENMPGQVAGIVGAGLEEAQQHLFDPSSGLLFSPAIGAQAQNKDRQTEIDMGLTASEMGHGGGYTPPVQQFLTPEQRRKIDQFNAASALNAGRATPIVQSPDVSEIVSTPDRKAPIGQQLNPAYDTRARVVDAFQSGGEGQSGLQQILSRLAEGWKEAGEGRRQLQSDPTAQAVTDFVNPATWIGPDTAVALAKIGLGPAVKAVPFLRQFATKIAPAEEAAEDIARATKIAKQGLDAASWGQQITSYPSVQSLLEDIQQAPESAWQWVSDQGGNLVGITKRAGGFLDERGRLSTEEAGEKGRQSAPWNQADQQTRDMLRGRDSESSEKTFNRRPEYRYDQNRPSITKAVENLSGAGPLISMIVGENAIPTAQAVGDYGDALQRIEQAARLLAMLRPTLGQQTESEDQHRRSRR